MHSVCIFGDSIAKGVILDEPKNRYMLLKDSFANIIQRQQNIIISNYSKFGCTISMGSSIFNKHGNDIRQFDCTVLEFGGNDCDYNWSEVSEKPYEKHQCNTPINQFREQYIALIEQVRNNGGRPLLLTLPPIDSGRYFKWISKGLNAKNILIFLGDIEKIHSWQGMYSSTISDLAKACKVPFIDLRAAFLEKKNYQDYLCEDGIHPNRDGHYLISKEIEKSGFL